MKTSLAASPPSHCPWYRLSCLDRREDWGQSWCWRAPGHTSSGWDERLTVDIVVTRRGDSTNLVYPNVHSLVVTFSRPGHKVAVVRSAGLEGDPLAGRVGQLLVNRLGHSPAVVNWLFSADLARLRAIAVWGNLLTNLFVDLDTLLHILHHRGVLIAGHARGLVLGLAHLIGNLQFWWRNIFLKILFSQNYLSVFRRGADSLHWVVALLQGLGDARLDVLDVAFLLKVLAALVLCWIRVTTDSLISRSTSVLGVYWVT